MKLKTAVSKALCKLETDGVVTMDQYKLISQKIPELNRPSMKAMAMDFFEAIFASYPARSVSIEDLSEFLRIRNEITHLRTPKINNEEYAKN